MLEIIKYLEIHLKLKLQQLVTDFIRDEEGAFWLLQIKAFKLLNNYSITFFKPFSSLLFSQYSFAFNKNSSLGHVKLAQKKLRLIPCRFCQIEQSIEQLPHLLTRQMILQTVNQLKVKNN